MRLCALGGIVPDHDMYTSLHIHVHQFLEAYFLGATNPQISAHERGGEQKCNGRAQAVR